MDRSIEAEIKAHLMQTNEEFRKLAEQHQDYKHKVEELEAKPFLTEQEEVEEHRLKKLKLHLKDVMEQMIHDHASQQVA
ncbi:MAG TPA: DUF465 domain-containing protein [Bryobacteraceae bacterium]|jgi:uncharacterized protein YdcH (DUF465 family)